MLRALAKHPRRLIVITVIVLTSLVFLPAGRTNSPSQGCVDQYGGPALPGNYGACPVSISGTKLGLPYGWLKISQDNYNAYGYDNAQYNDPSSWYVEADTMRLTFDVLTWSLTLVVELVVIKIYCERHRANSRH